MKNGNQQRLKEIDISIKLCIWFGIIGVIVIIVGSIILGINLTK